jgi:uncharacterized damage-inducible protein DinB
MDRIEPDPTGDERTLLTQFLDHHRATLLWKAEGLGRAGLTATTAASSLHPAGLLKHLAGVEHGWFRMVLDGEPEHPVFAEVDWDADPDWEFRTAADDDPDSLRQLYLDACEASRRAVEAHDLDDRAVGTRRDGRHPTLRWILLHMIEETARHNGHADLLREAVDGATGE